MGYADLSRVDPDHVWPLGLLAVEDCGCGIYRAVDLEDSELRVVEYEHLEPIDEPSPIASGEAPFAYQEPVVPRSVQHRFVLVARSLDAWASAQG